MSVLERSSARCAVGVLAALALAGCGDVGGDRASERELSGGHWEATLGGEPVELERHTGSSNVARFTLGE